MKELYKQTGLVMSTLTTMLNLFHRRPLLFGNEVIPEFIAFSLSVTPKNKQVYAESAPQNKEKSQTPQAAADVGGIAV